MSSDEGESESSRRSSSLQLGGVDRHSGFFTPVWEKTKRSEPEEPIPLVRAKSSSMRASGAQFDDPGTEAAAEPESVAAAESSARRASNPPPRSADMPLDGAPEPQRARAWEVRSRQVTATAAHLHQQLKSQSNAGADADAGYCDTLHDFESASSTSTRPADPLATEIIRRFRRTIRLSSPLPEPLRSDVVRLRDT